MGGSDVYVGAVTRSSQDSWGYDVHESWGYHVGTGNTYHNGEKLQSSLPRLAVGQVLRVTLRDGTLTYRSHREVRIITIPGLPAEELSLAVSLNHAKVTLLP